MREPAASAKRVMEFSCARKATLKGAGENASLTRERRTLQIAIIERDGMESLKSKRGRNTAGRWNRFPQKQVRASPAMFFAFPQRRAGFFVLLALLGDAVGPGGLGRDGSAYGHHAHGTPALIGVLDGFRDDQWRGDGCQVNPMTGRAERRARVVKRLPRVEVPRGRGMRLIAFGTIRPFIRAVHPRSR
jgi:hypothetical protein